MLMVVMTNPPHRRWRSHGQVTSWRMVNRWTSSPLCVAITTSSVTPLLQSGHLTTAPPRRHRECADHVDRLGDACFQSHDAGAPGPLAVLVELAVDPLGNTRLVFAVGADESTRLSVEAQQCEPAGATGLVVVSHPRSAAHTAASFLIPAPAQVPAQAPALAQGAALDVAGRPAAEVESSG
jgi:hypothetical protein